MLSWITTHLVPEAVQSILDGVTIGATQRAEGDDPAMVEGDHDIEKEVCVATVQVLVEMHVTNWATAQGEDPKLDAILCWLEDTPGGACFQWGGPNSMEESSKFHGSPRCPLSALHAQRREWGSTTLHSAKGTSDCHLKWVSLRCRTSSLWLYSILTTRMFLVAQNGQTDETNY